MKMIEVIARGLCVKDRHLLVYQNTRYGYFCLPGGHVEFTESSKDALLREWQEEVGCDGIVGAYIKHFEFVFEREGKVHHQCVFLYQMICDSLDVKIPLQRMEPHIALQWMPLEKFPSCHFVSKEQQKFLCEYLKIS